LTSQTDNFQTLSHYLYQVFVLGLATELILFFLKFFASSFCIKFNILGINVFTISDWFAEMLKYEKFEPKKVWFGLPLILTIEIWTKGEPIKEKSDDDNAVDADIEMGKVDEVIQKPVESTTVIVANDSSNATEDALPQPPSNDNTVMPPNPSDIEVKIEVVESVEKVEKSNDISPVEKETEIKSVESIGTSANEVNVAVKANEEN